MNKLILILTLAMLTASCAKKPEAAAAAEQPAVVKNVATENVKHITADDFYEATGTVRSQTATTLSSKIVGTITALNVHEGDRVRAGQTLIELENRDARAQLERAQAGLREAQAATEEVEKNMRAAESAKTAAEAQRQLAAATLKRYQALLERQSVSPQEFDEVQARARVAEAEAERADRLLQTLNARKNQVQARIDQAKAEVGSAQVAASYARITAPINGIVTAKPAELGTLAAPGTPLLTIEDGANYRLEAAVEESRIRDLRLNAPANVTIDALGGAELSGRVVEIVPAADPASRSYTVKIALPPQRFLRSGLFGKARFVTGQKQLLAVPNKALVQRGQLTSVYVVDQNSIARIRLVTLGKARGALTEILSGLNEGERIVTDAAAIAREGVKVQ